MVYFIIYYCIHSKTCPADWVDKIQIPTRFSLETTETLRLGVPTKKARDEIVNSLSTLIMVYTMNPTSKDLNAVCQKLINKHPVLTDHVRGSYVS